MPRLLLTPGEPAGVGPELACRLAMQEHAADIVAIADPGLLSRTAAQLGLDLQIEPFNMAWKQSSRPGHLQVLAEPLCQLEVPGHPAAENASYVLNCLEQASRLCLSGRADALVTGPLQKASINAAGVAFSGHTEFLASRAAVPVLMLLTAPQLRVALTTTHLPLANVAAAITTQRLREKLLILNASLQRDFGLAEPRIAVLGLNPHAGEDGYLGKQEIEIIAPVLDTLRGQGLHLLGPLPADTALLPAMRKHYDAVLAMYHDQALPVLKAEAFASAVNITLGLPYVRTSVDHGTALDLAGRGCADPSSLMAACHTATTMVTRRLRPES